MSVTSRAGAARVSVDITELKAEFARIAESQSKLHAVIDAIVADLEGQR